MVPTRRKVPQGFPAGYPAKGWETRIYRHWQVTRHAFADGCGIRTGQEAGGLIVFDLDGSGAISFAQSKDCDPATAESWQITRSDTADRLKVCFRATPEQLNDLEEAAGGPFKRVHTVTHKTPDGEKKQAVEVFCGIGQIVALGNHPAGGEYQWKGSPQELATLPDEWFSLAMEIIREQGQRKRSTSTGGGGVGWSKVNPCPICGRNDHLACGVSDDGKAVNCVDGQTFSYRIRHGAVAKGSIVRGLDGQDWKLIKENGFNDQFGQDTATFAVHDPLGGCFAGKLQQSPTTGATPGQAAPEEQQEEEEPFTLTPEQAAREAELIKQRTALQKELAAFEKKDAFTVEELRERIAATGDGQRWPDPALQSAVEHLAKLIGIRCGLDGTDTNLEPLRDAVCARFKGVGKKWLKKRITEQQAPWEIYREDFKKQLRDVQEEIDAPRQEAAKESDAEALRDIHGYPAVLAAAGEGWAYDDKNKNRYSTSLRKGDLSVALTERLPKRLGFCELKSVATLDREELKPPQVEDFHVRLSENGWDINKNDSIDSLVAAARKNTYHPVREYLERIESDDTIIPADLNTLARDYFKVEDPLQATFIVKALLAAVWRVRRPGYDFKHCLTLVSDKQTCYKSLSFKCLASEEWFGDAKFKGERDCLLKLHQTWIFELGELEKVTTKKDAAELKSILSVTTDSFRDPYGRTNYQHPRAGIFVATSNRRDFLVDPTGNTRFWIVDIKEKLDYEKITRDRDRIWKALAQRQSAGERPYLSDQELEASEVRNEDFQSEDPWVAPVEAWLRGLRRDAIGHLISAPSGPFSSADALTLGVGKPAGQLGRSDEMRISTLLKKLGYKKARASVEGSRVYRWFRVDPGEGWGWPR